MNPRATSTAPAPGVDTELKALLRQVKLGRCLDTLPERLALARTESLPHADFLTLLLSDEVERRDRSSAVLRARAAKLDPGMRIDTFNTDTGAVFDRQLWNELCSLRFVDDAYSAPTAHGGRSCPTATAQRHRRSPPRMTGSAPTRGENAERGGGGGVRCRGSRPLSGTRRSSCTVLTTISYLCSDCFSSDE